MHKISLVDHGSALSVRLGELMEVSLPENPSTGFRWQLDSAPAELKLVQDQFTQVVDSSGTRQLYFVAELPGEIQLRLGLRRAWETPGASIRELEVRIAIA